MEKETPKYYGDLKMMPIEYLMISMNKDEFKGYLKGNIVKYIIRADNKNGIDDYQKACVYARWLEEFVRTGTIVFSKGE
jgi:hypothetical protein